MQCKYVKHDGSRCHREALPNSEKGYCILHEDWDRKDAEETGKEFYREIEGGITDFEGCILAEINLSGREFEGGLNFRNATIEYAWFNGATIKGYAYFEGATVEGPFWFSGATIEGNAWFLDAILKEVVAFKKATIEGYAYFEGATIEGNISFFLSNITLLSFKNAKFTRLSAQEAACRTARITQERMGNRQYADDHFYREMEAKRKQKYLKFSLKPILNLIRKLRLEKLVRKHIGFLEKERRIYWGFLELPVQYIFGYGVHPWRVIVTLLVTVFCFAFVYWLGNGVEAADSFLEYLYFSVVTAATPGYGGYKPVPGFYQGLASFEAIFGIFMWAAFIATSARKYMR